jgi:hypothetical protein
MKFTDMTLQKLPIPADGQKLYSDDALPGFGVKVSLGGAKSFILTVGKQRQRITIGRYPIVTLAQARERARTILAERQLGIVEKPSPIFKAVRVEYLAQRDDRLRSSTRRADGYLFKLFDGFSQKKMADISAENIEDIIKELDATSTRHHAFLRVKGLFAYAVKRGYIERSPVDRLDCPPVEEPRERVLTPNELRKVIVTARQYPHAYGTIIELCAITGQRRKLTQEGGTNLTELTQAVDGVYSYADERRAALIAKTESFRAANLANKDAWRLSGVVKTVKWFTSEQDNVCQYCLALEGTEIPIDQNFFDIGDTVKGVDGGFMTLDYSDVEAPPIHPSCACFIRPENISI